MNRDRERENPMARVRDLERCLIGTDCPDLARKKIMFQRLIEDSFESFFEPGSRQNSIQWRCVKRFYNSMKNNLENIWSLRIFCKFVFKLFCKYDCEDHQLIMKIIYMYHEVLNQYETLDFCASCMRLNNPRHYFYEDFRSTRSILSKVNRMTESFYRYSNRELYSNFSFDSIDEGDYDFLKFLVKYGLSYSQVNQLEKASDQLKRLFILYCSFKSRQWNDSEKDAFVESVLKKVLDEENPNFLRLNLILAYVLISLDKRLGDAYYKDYVSCLNMYALTLPETVISLKDVENCLNLAFADDVIFISGMCSVFQEIFPESPKLSSPRPLKYLCRCNVRDHIEKFPSFPVVISAMQIPGLKEYLLVSSD